ncbi:GFA family protein [Bradyrhizobium sp. LjRoot220]|uniref:GFA family protein n=1 Tax=Bradyrhizobium sp. LjRoot220 TaxID=3342284 RepID=UPI003ED05A4A
MASERKAVLTGGCQCGAVRFALYASPVKIGLCHCRMCQKAVGGPFISLAEVKHEDFAWTRGKPAAFRSSSIAARDFCAACGTPLSYRVIDGNVIEITTGSFDRPDLVVPTYATGTESHLAWVGRIGDLPGKSTLEGAGSEVLSRIVSHQHPDHD